MRKPTTSPVFSGLTAIVARGISTCAATEKSPVIMVPSQSIDKLVDVAQINSPADAPNIRNGISLALFSMSPKGTMNSKPKA